MYIIHKYGGCKYSTTSLAETVTLMYQQQVISSIDRYYTEDIHNILIKTTEHTGIQIVHDKP